MYKSCSRCGKIHDINYHCHKNKHRTDIGYVLKNTYAWQKKSLQIREDARYLCEVCIDKDIITPANEVHHIIKVKDDKEKLLDDFNLICLCTTHHKQADANLIDKNYLLGLAKKRIENIQAPLPWL